MIFSGWNRSAIRRAKRRIDHLVEARAHAHGQHQIGRDAGRRLERQHCPQPAIGVPMPVDHGRRIVEWQGARSVQSIM